jgi:hypothetical protein
MISFFYDITLLPLPLISYENFVRTSLTAELLEFMTALVMNHKVDEVETPPLVKKMLSRRAKQSLS